jgi:uncharacterized protein YbjT (DUF2867 family)
MSDKKIIAVVGATGAQGGGLVRAILADESGEFQARAITRDPTSEKAQALAAQGAEVVQADLDDPSSLERAFAGAYGAFCVTNFWEHFSPEKEGTQAENMARAAKAAGVKHAIWSTLEDTRRWIPLDDDRMPTLMESYKVPHFDGKGAADAAFAEAGPPTTNLLTSFYWDNLIHFGMGPQRGEDGVLGFNLPMGQEKLPGIAAEDIGRSAFGIFKGGSEFFGKTVGVAGEHLSGAQMAEVLTSELGEPVKYNAIPFDLYRSFDFDGADDLGNMFQFNHDFADGFRGARPVSETKGLNPSLQSFKEWVKANKERIPLGEA